MLCGKNISISIYNTYGYDEYIQMKFMKYKHKYIHTQDKS